MKIKKRLKKQSFLRRVKQTRGTTQIAKIPFRHLFEVQQLLCTDVAYTGNAYWVIDLWGFRLRRDGNSAVLYRAHTTPDSLEKFVADSVFIDAFENCLLNLSILYHHEAAVSIQWPHKKYQELLTIFCVVHNCVLHTDCSICFCYPRQENAVTFSSREQQHMTERTDGAFSINLLHRSGIIYTEMKW